LKQIPSAAGKEQSVERKRVKSDKVRAVGYDPTSRVLEVELRDGTVLAYSGVSQEVHRQFMNAPSPSSYYEDKIADEFSARRL
jgi:hypothetical protein